MAGVTVTAALAQAAAAGLDRLSAQRLLGLVLGRPREWLIAHGRHDTWTPPHNSASTTW